VCSLRSARQAVTPAGQTVTAASRGGRGSTCVPLDRSEDISNASRGGNTFSTLDRAEEIKDECCGSTLSQHSAGMRKIKKNAAIGGISTLLALGWVGKIGKGTTLRRRTKRASANGMDP